MPHHPDDTPAPRDSDPTLPPGAPSDETLATPAGAPRPTFTRSEHTDKPGDQIGPYKLISRLGEGGFGEVWLAERKQPFVQQVALKVIKAGMDSKAVIGRFEQERQALAVMNHPHVAKVLDGGLTPQGRPYFAMEFVKGEPITAFCDRHRLSLKDRLRLMLQVCQAIEHAHSKGIIHRDLKPANILVSMEAGDVPMAKVIDFGIAKAITARLTEKTVFTETGQMIGTPEYMSPEQADPGEMDIDTRTDVYSLGVVLYELIAGAPPFDATTLRSRAYREVQRMIQEVEPPSPSARFTALQARDADRASGIATARREDPGRLARTIRSELEWIPLKALRKDRVERYASVTEFAADVDRYIRGEVLAAGPITWKYRVGKWLAKREVAAAWALVAIDLLLSPLQVHPIGVSPEVMSEFPERISPTAVAGMASMLVAGAPGVIGIFALWARPLLKDQCSALSRLLLGPLFSLIFMLSFMCMICFLVVASMHPSGRSSVWYLAQLGMFVYAMAILYGPGLVARALGASPLRMYAVWILATASIFAVEATKSVYGTFWFAQTERSAETTRLQEERSKQAHAPDEASPAPADPAAMSPPS